MPGAAPVRATFNYCAGPAHDVLITNPFEGDGHQRNEAAGAIRGVEQDVLDGRADPVLTDPSGAALARRGFCLVQHASTVCDFGDAAEVERVYHPELVSLARRLTGAACAAVTSVVFRRAGETRSNPGENKAGGGARGGAYFVHNDFHNRLRQQFLEMYAEQKPSVLSSPPMSMSEERVRRGRLVMVNLWRPLNAAPLRRSPVAVCDATSLDPRNLHVYEHRPAELPPNYQNPFPILLTLPDSGPGQRWYYFPGMTRSECMVFKTFDSAGPIPGNGVGVHSAFDLPDTPRGEPARESIEARVLCLIDPPDARL